MQPVLKVGSVHTTEEQGFEVRKPQCALKLAQPKITMSLRRQRSKAKGMIELLEPYENYFVVPAEKFVVLHKQYRPGKKTKVMQKIFILKKNGKRGRIIHLHNKSRVIEIGKNCNKR